MKRFSILASALLLSLTAWAQQSNDPIIMKVAGKAVPRSEFEYNFNKNNTEGVIDRKSIEEYVDLFAAYKMKVQAAMDAHYDTLSSYQQEFRTYRDQQIRPLLVPASAEEQEVRNYYDGMLKQLNGHDLRMPAHIFLRVSPNATAEEQATAKTRIDSIYNALQNGAEFAELARACSDDQQTGEQGGLIRQWFGPGQLLPALEETMYALKDSGDYAAPILSTVGYHIVQLRGKKNLEPYAQLAPNIRQYLEQRGMKDQLAGKIVDSLATKRGLSIDQLLDMETERLCAQDMELKYLVQEYHDGLLLYEICNREVWTPASTDTLGLQKYFKDNKKNYNWDKPHFMGMVYYCKNQEDVAKVKKLLKGVPEKDWTKTVREHFNADSVTVRMEQKLFAMGDNKHVDSLALKVKKADAKPRKDYPYSGVVGIVLKKGPKQWTNISAQIVADYQQACDAKFVEELRKRYAVEVDKEVLKTVNNHQ